MQSMHIMHIMHFMQPMQIMQSYKTMHIMQIMQVMHIMQIMQVMQIMQGYKIMHFMQTMQNMHGCRKAEGCRCCGKRLFIPALSGPAGTVAVPCFCCAGRRPLAKSRLLPLLRFGCLVRWTRLSFAVP